MGSGQLRLHDFLPVFREQEISCMALSVQFIYLAACLAQQWVKDQGTIDMRLRANKPNELGCLVHGYKWSCIL